MKYVIDIPMEYYEVIKKIPVETYTADMLIIANGKPLDDVLDEIKKEFKRKANSDDWYHTTDGLVWEEAIEIIDKHRKGEEDGRLLGMRKCKYPNV